MVKKALISLSILSLLSFIVATNFEDLVIEELNTYTKNFPEKIYLHTDKPYYSIGDDIWFSAYLVNGVNHEKTDKSNVIYVELINDKDSIISQKKLYTNDISSAGDFKIKKEWKSGKYLLRAYTNYMRNSNSNYFFKKEISIWNIKTEDVLKNINVGTSNSKASEKEEVSLTEGPDLNFYPEGGYLVNNIPSKVAIKVKDKKNRNITIEGVIEDDENNTIKTFKTHEFGMGLCTFTPKPDKNYHASITINGKKEIYPLPKALPQGFSLNLLNDGKEVLLKVSSNDVVGLQNALLVAHQRGQIIYKKLVETTVNTYTIKLKTTELKSGIIHFTLFNNLGQPVCERLTFVNNDAINVSVSKNKKPLTTKEKVTFNIDLQDENSKPVSGNLSLTINSLNFLNKNSSSENIKTYLLLNSDLRGHIENPEYFFEKKNDPKRRFLLDLVMLTHGWSRFTWNDLLYNSPKIKPKFKTEKGLYISGQTQALKEIGKGISTATRLSFISATPHQEQIQSNENGLFNFGPYVFYDSIPTLIEARVKKFKSDYKKNRDVNIFFRNTTKPSPLISYDGVLKQKKIDKTTMTNIIKQSQSIEEYLQETQLLEEVIIKANIKTKKEKREKELDERAAYFGFKTHRLDVNDIPGAQSLSIFNLLSQLPSVRVINNDVSIRNSTPLILVDGFESEIEDIEFLTGSDVEFIDVLTIENTIAIYTKLENGATNIKRKPGIIDFYYPGFYTAREFYAPDYSDSFNDNLKQNIRSTLYWNPKIVVKKDAKTEVSFFTSNTKSMYSIEIEGITTEGRPVYNLSTFEVE